MDQSSMNDILNTLLQRKFRIGYNKAARIIDRLEEDGGLV